MKRSVLLVSVLAIACGETTTNPPSQLNLDRPMDIAFACYGGMRVTEGRTVGSIDDPVTFSAQTPVACEIKSAPRAEGVDPIIPGQEDLSDQGGLVIQPSVWFGFVLQSGPGTVAIAQFPAKPSATFQTGGEIQILDADPLTPNKNSISIGEDPIAIATDSAGCKVLTANAGSCDLSVLDIASAVDFDPSTEIQVSRLEVKNAAGEVIRARPAAMMSQPPIEEFGKTCQATPTGLMYVAYPNCHLVAGIDVSTGTIVTGIQFAADGTASIVDGNVTCPDECGGGGAIITGPRPVTIDIEKDPRTMERRLVIGADNSPTITVVELADDTNLPESAIQYPLEGEVGVTHLALSPTIGMGGSLGMLNDDNAVGGQAQYVYAIATDHTIRVVDVLEIGRECDTQIDPRYTRDIRSVRELSCLQIGDVDTPDILRRAGAKGPGIELVSDGVPVSLDIVQSPGPAPPESAGNLVGYFAAVSTTTGLTFVINIDDDGRRDLFETADPITIAMPLAAAHQLRDNVDGREALAVDTDPNSPTVGMQFCDIVGPAVDANILLGGPRTTQNPGRTVPNGVFAPEKVTTLPGIRSVRCEGIDLGGLSTVRAVSELGFTASETDRDLAYPDLRALRTEETWTLTWEGNISLDRSETANDGPQIRESEMFVDAAGMRIVDQTKPFCDAGVEDFDILQVRGCDPAFGNTDCPIGYRCFVHPNSQVQGIGACMLEDEADRLADACKDYLTSLRRYTVGTTKSGSLGLLPRRHTLTSSPLEGCTSNEQCDAIADYAARSSNSLHPIDDTEVDERTWTCELDPNRRPMPADTTGKRCQLRCDATADCVTGTICQGGTEGSGTKAGFCMESVVPPQACVNAPQRYEVRVGDAFAVVGERSGFDHATTVATDGTDRCVRLETENPYQTSRIPLDVEDCTGDPITGRRTDGSFDPNPCRVEVTQTEITLLYTPGTCQLANPSSEIRDRQATALRYRNRGMTMNIVDPVYPGDQTCILDRLGAPLLGGVEIPQVFGGYQIIFRQTAGFVSQALPIQPSFPVRVVRGPGNSWWVIDEGDFLSTSISQPSTRGRIFRVEGSLRAFNSAE